MKHVPDEIRETIGKALGRIPSGVFVLTAEHNGTASAMLASWVQQAAFDPPSISVAIAKDRSIAALVRGSRRLAISVLPENDTTLMKRYARGVKENEDPFSGINTLTAPSGLRVFAEARAWLDCRVLSICEFESDHDLFVAEVTAGRLISQGASFTHQRGSGFHYSRYASNSSTNA